MLARSLLSGEEGGFRQGEEGTDLKQYYGSCLEASLTSRTVVCGIIAVTLDAIYSSPAGTTLLAVNRHLSWEACAVDCRTFFCTVHLKNCKHTVIILFHTEIRWLGSKL